MKFTARDGTAAQCRMSDNMNPFNHHPRTFSLLGLALTISIGGCGGGSVPAPLNPPTATPPAEGAAWWGFARDAQHSGQGASSTQPLSRLLWRTPVDLEQRLVGSSLLAHYGSPVITSRNTVLIPVKTGSLGGFRIEARSAASGVALWMSDSDYILPPHNWTPSYNLTLTPGNRLYAPGSGGRLLFRDNPDTGAVALQSAVFYGAAVYAAARAAFDATVFINTPLTSDSQGNIFFGFTVRGDNPAGLTSGIARLSADGSGSWVGAAVVAGESAVIAVAMNSAPALSPDQKTVYVAVSATGQGDSPTGGYLLALDSTTLVRRGKRALMDPVTGTMGGVNGNGTSSPTVGPDGDVYFGVLEANIPRHNARGWLLHFDAALTQDKTPGSFGWDITASIVPASMVPSYRGSASYLVATKYNNYAGTGTGDGKNRMAVLDPQDSQADAISGAPVMREVLTVLGVTPDSGPPGAVKEWCINTAAVDPMTRSILVNSEDGYLYRWDLTRNELSERIQLTSGIRESYTPTAIGPDGVVYAVNNSVLFAVGR